MVILNECTGIYVCQEAPPPPHTFQCNSGLQNVSCAAHTCTKELSNQLCLSVGLSGQ